VQNYFIDPWNVLDFVIVVGSVTDIVLEYVLVSCPVFCIVSLPRVNYMFKIYIDFMISYTTFAAICCKCCNISVSILRSSFSQTFKYSILDAVPPIHARPVHGPKISCPARPGPLTIRPGPGRPVIPVQFVGPARLGPFT